MPQGVSAADLRSLRKFFAVRSSITSSPAIQIEYSSTPFPNILGGHFYPVAIKKRRDSKSTRSVYPPRKCEHSRLRACLDLPRGAVPIAGPKEFFPCFAVSREPPFASTNGRQKLEMIDSRAIEFGKHECFGKGCSLALRCFPCCQ